MRPTGVVLIALYHFLSALFLVMLAIFLLVGGTFLGAMFAGHDSPLGGMGFLVGIMGAMFFFFFAIVATIAGYGIWMLREWGRILCLVLAVIALLFSLPGLLLLGLHFNLFFGTYRLFRIAISILIIWYLVQPQIKALFIKATPAMPRA